MKKIKSSILALSVGTAMGMMVATQAQAGVLGSAILDVSNFFIVNSAGNVPTGIAVLEDNRNGEISIGLNGVNAGNTGNASDSADLNLAPVLLGTNPGIGDNSATILPDGTGTFSRSDLNVSGTIFGEGGQGFVRSDAYALTGGNQGNANATIANNVLAQYVINVDADTMAAFTLDASGYLKAFVSDDLFGTGSNANASISFSIDVFRAGESEAFFTWAPTQINRGVTANGVVGFNDVGGSFSYDELTSPFANLTAGSYNVTIQQKSTAREVANNQIPEPGIIALLSLGLLGMGASVRRRIK